VGIQWREEMKEYKTNRQVVIYLFIYFNFPLRFNIAIFIKIIFPTASLNIE
jgi:hypothetical protein